MSRKWVRAKCVYSDSVSRLEKMYDHSQANPTWKSQRGDIQQTNFFSDNNFGIDGEPTKFDWKVFPGLPSLEILHKIPEDLNGREIKPEQLEGRILFMSMFQRHCLDKEGTIFRLHVEVREGKRRRKKGVREDTGHSAVLKKKFSDMERTL